MVFPPNGPVAPAARPAAPAVPMNAATAARRRAIVQGDLIRHETNLAASPVEYDLVKTLSGSVPANLTFAYNRAGLAREHLTVRDFGERTDGVAFDPRASVNIGDAGRATGEDAAGFKAVVTVLNSYAVS
jgi:hypothetical protein